MTTIFSFDTTQLPNLEQAGGKALALIEMTNAGMPVPPGFVLTVDFSSRGWMPSKIASLVCADNCYCERDRSNHPSDSGTVPNSDLHR